MSDSHRPTPFRSSGVGHGSGENVHDPNLVTEHWQLLVTIALPGGGGGSQGIVGWTGGQSCSCLHSAERGGVPSLHTALKYPHVARAKLFTRSDAGPASCSGRRSSGMVAIIALLKRLVPPARD